MASSHDETLVRRAFIQRCAASAFGVSLMPGLAGAFGAAPSASAGKGFGKAKHVIWLDIGGGLTHIDTFDPKKGESRGPTDAIATSAGDEFGEWIEQTAKIADKITVIRSMTADIGTHREASYFMRTAYKQLGTLYHPMLGAYAHAMLGPSHPVLPSTVTVNQGSRYGNGFLPATMSPLPILDPDAGLQNVEPSGKLADLKASLEQLDRLDKPFRDRHPDQNVKAYSQFYDGAMRIMGGKEGDVFDLTKEPDAMRDAYGRTKFGQGCLLARRLVEEGVRFIEVGFGGWDFHKNLVPGLEELSPALDQGYAQLITDLDARGLLDETLVVMTSEFGRDPSVNNGGRGHHPAAFSTVVAGGGTKRGFIYGATDDRGGKVEKDPVTPGDLHATIGWAMGIDLDKPVHSPSGRPIPIGDHGAKPVLDLFA